FDRMAELAAEEAARPVAIGVPALEGAVVWPGSGHEETRPEAGKAPERVAAAPIDGEPAAYPDGLPRADPTRASSQARCAVGRLGMLGGGAASPDQSGEFLHRAARADATAFALEEARERDAHTGGVVEGLLRGALDTGAATRRAAVAGCDLTAGLAASVTEL